MMVVVPLPASSHVVMPIDTLPMLAAFYLALTPEGSEASITQTWMGQVSVIDLSSIQVGRVDRRNCPESSPAPRGHVDRHLGGVANDSSYPQVIAD